MLWVQIRLVLWDLIEPLPWIEPDISKAWHGRGLLLSSHCFIYHPEVSVFVCMYVFTYLGLSQECLRLNVCSDVRVCESKRERECHKHICTHVFGTLDSVQVLCFLLLFSYIIFIPQGRRWSQGQNFDEVCVFICLFVLECVWVCVSIYNTRTVMQRGAAYWLMKWSRREGLCAGRQSYTATTSHSPNLGHTHRHSHTHTFHSKIFLITIHAQAAPQDVLKRTSLSSAALLCAV